MKRQQVRNIRVAVCTMANELRKTGLSLSAAFKKAWIRIKSHMTVRAAGVTFNNRQEILKFLLNFRPEDLSLSLKREPGNKHDSNAIGVVVHIKPLQKQAHIGYIPKGLSREVAKVIEKGVIIKSSLLGIIGGYSYKENYGLLLRMSV